MCTLWKLFQYFVDMTFTIDLDAIKQYHFVSKSTSISKILVYIILLSEKLDPTVLNMKAIWHLKYFFNLFNL